MDSGYLALAQRAFAPAAQRAAGTFTNDSFEALTKRAALVLQLSSDSAMASNRVPSIATWPIDVSQAKSLGLRVRNVFKVGPVDPIPNLPGLIESSFGIHVVGLEQSDIAGACAIMGNSKVIFVSESSDFETLYICARQLGHLIALSARSKKGVFAVIETKDSFAGLKSPYERFADHFALELLITDRALGVSLTEIRKLLQVTNPSLGEIEMLYLARIFGVSFLMLARRCERAGLLPEGGALAFNRFLNEKFGGSESRANQLKLPARGKLMFFPISMQLAIKMRWLVERRKFTLQELAIMFACSSERLKNILFEEEGLL
jgi:Zn-dependent peptidase ImmA (M78 family)